MPDFLPEPCLYLHCLTPSGTRGADRGRPACVFVCVCVVFGPLLAGVPFDTLQAQDLQYLYIIYIYIYTFTSCAFSLSCRSSCHIEVQLSTSQDSSAVAEPGTGLHERVHGPPGSNSSTSTSGGSSGASTASTSCGMPGAGTTNAGREASTPCQEMFTMFTRIGMFKCLMFKRVFCFHGLMILRYVQIFERLYF